MAVLLLLKDNENDTTHAVYSVDARELFKQAPKRWEFVRRLNDRSTLVEPGVALEGASESATFVGERLPGTVPVDPASDKLRIEQLEAELAERKAADDAADEAAAAEVEARADADADEVDEQDVGATSGTETGPTTEVETEVVPATEEDAEAPQGTRGGGPQEPAQADPGAVEIAS